MSSYIGYSSDPVGDADRYLRQQEEESRRVEELIDHLTETVLEDAYNGKYEALHDMVEQYSTMSELLEACHLASIGQPQVAKDLMKTLAYKWAEENYERYL